MKSINAEIICIGTELLLGHIVNTNQSYLSRQLAGLGINLYFHHTVGDNPDRLKAVLGQVLERSDLVITTGGLGPTVDDITAATIADFLGRGMTRVIEGAKILPNRVGTAPGLILNERGKLLILLPGPPLEMIPMFEKEAAPFLKKYFRLSGAIETRALKISGRPESYVNDRVKDLLRLSGSATVGIYAHLAEVDLKITAKGPSRAARQKAIRALEKTIRRRLKNDIFGVDDQTLESVVRNLLLKKNVFVSIAESCTGGLISHRITNVAGSSGYFLGSIVAYNNWIKTELLNVKEQTIETYGAVSAPVARAMADGCRQLFESDLAIAVTGIAGPGGGTRRKPVGLVYIAISNRPKTTDRPVPSEVEGRPQTLVKKYQFAGNRQAIKNLAATAALDLLRRNLLS